MRRERGDEKELFAVVCDAKYLASERQNTDAGKRKKLKPSVCLHFVKKRYLKILLTNI